MTTANRQLLEKLLDSKASSYAGSVVVLPLLLAFILLGSITYTVGKQTAPIIQKILTPPQTRQQEQFKFEDMAPVNNEFQTSFEEFQQNEVELFSISDVVEAADATRIELVRKSAATEVAMSQAPTGEAWNFDDTAASVQTAFPRDPSLTMTVGEGTKKLDTTLRKAGGTPLATGLPLPEQPAAAVLGKDKSGQITADPTVEKTVVINRGDRNAGQGAGLRKPASQEKMDLMGWILGHPRRLPPAVAEALELNSQKADRTSTGSVVDETGKLYQFFFLHRTQNNLLRILVVLGNQAYRIDLPDFYLEANHVQTGRVFRGPPPEDDPFAPGPVIEVALESVSAIPNEVPEIFGLVLDWLEIKGRK